MATQVVNVTLRSAISERDSISKKLAELERNNKQDTPEYQKLSNDFKRAEDNLRNLENQVRATGAKVTSKQNAKKIRNLQADYNDAIRRKDTAKADELKQKLNQVQGVEERRPEMAAGTEVAAPTTTPTTGEKKTGTTGSITSELQTAAKTAKETAAKTSKPKSIDEIYNLATQEFGSIDLIFKQDEELKKILTQAVNENWTQQKFTNAIQNTTWFKSKAPELQTREFNKRQYRELLQQPNADKQALYKNTEYGRGLARTIQMVKDQAIAAGAAIDEATAETIAQDLYDSANETDPYTVRNQIRSRISYKQGANLGGSAGIALRDLQNTARANGLNLDAQFANSIQGWLQRINEGDSVETYKQIIRNTAKVGLPEKVASLIDNGVDLDTIYTPYKNMMAATLEINPETIDLNNPTLRMGIGPDKEMSLYDYQRALRKDPRWEYTNNARADVSKAALQVLKDFGFQG